VKQGTDLIDNKENEIHMATFTTDTNTKFYCDLFSDTNKMIRQTFG